MKQRLHQTLLAGIVSGSFFMSAHAGNVTFNQIPFEITGGGPLWMQVSDNGDVAFTADSNAYIWSAQGGSTLIQANSSGVYSNISNDGRTVWFGSSIFKDENLTFQAPSGHWIGTLSAGGNLVSLVYGNTVPKILNLDTGSTETLDQEMFYRYVVTDFSNDGKVKLLSGARWPASSPNFYDPKPFYLLDESNNVHEISTRFGDITDLSGDGTTVIGRATFTCDSGATSCNIIYKQSGSFEINSVITGNATVFYNALNNDGTIAVGSYRDYGNNNWAGRIWDAENGERDIADVLAQNGIDISAWDQVRLSNISDNGHYIVGHGVNPQGQRRGFIIGSVPQCSPGGLF